MTTDDEDQTEAAMIAAAIDAALAANDGDARAAIAGLLLEIAGLQSQVHQLTGLVSHGYIRGIDIAGEPADEQEAES